MDILPTPRDIERLAFEAEISVAELCRRADVSVSIFTRWKQATGYSPRLSTIQKLLDAAKHPPEGSIT